MKKVVLKVEFQDGKVKQKAMKVVSGLSGVESIAMDTGNKKLTVTGDIDPVGVVAKLRKLCHTEILTVGPAKEPEKKKDDGNKEDDKKKDSKADAKAQAYPVYTSLPYYHPQQLAYNYQQSHVPTHYYQRSAEEDPNACVIC